MLKICLARVGKKKQPTYRLIVTEASRDPWGKFLEILGHYNPRTKVKSLNVERIKYWLSCGAKPSATVHNMLVGEKVISGPKAKASKTQKKTKKEEKAPEKPEKKKEEVEKKAPQAEEKKEPLPREESQKTQEEKSSPEDPSDEKPKEEQSSEKKEESAQEKSPEEAKT